MSRLQERHTPVCGKIGACSVPMFLAGGDAGFCDRPSYGEQFEGPFYIGQINKPFAVGMCCEHHGGPREDSRYFFVRDGSDWCAFRKGFENLQESVAGFGITQERALTNLIQNEADAMLAERAKASS